MGTYDIRNDTPNLLTTESLDTKIRFDRTGPTTGLVSWNIPIPATGCASDTQAYCGIVVTLNTVPAKPADAPTNGTVYTSDPTGDANLFAGDKINNALVVGAFYEDRITTSFEITGLQANAAYFISGYPVDCQHRYYKTGIYAYSLEYDFPTGTDQSGYQLVSMGGSGVLGTAGTGLVTGSTYNFELTIDGHEVPAVTGYTVPPGATYTGGTEYTISLDGGNALTYTDLVKEINKQISLLENPLLGPVPPNTGAYYWNNTTKKLFLWDGSQHVEQPVIYKATQPNIPTIGEYWYNTLTGALTKWDGAIWQPQTVIQYYRDPTALGCDDYWFNGTTIYNWSGTTWVGLITYNQSIDPSLPPVFTCDTYWFDTTNDVLGRWNETTLVWEQTEAIAYNIDPNTLTLGTYWFDTSTNTLNQLDTPSPGWNDVSLTATVKISETAPATPAAGTYWYNPATKELKQRDITNTTWNTLPAIVWATNPQTRSTGQLWWDTTLDQLYMWDITTGSWDFVPNFLITSTNPAAAPTIAMNSAWYNTSTNKVYKWDGNTWLQVQFIYSITDPTLPAINDIWFNTTTSAWNVWTGAWTTFTPVNSSTDPYTPPLGSYWFNSTLSSLNQWSGATWIPLLYSSTPLTPPTGQLWYDLINEQLKTWSGTAWVAATPLATISLNSDGDLIFVRSKPGSSASLKVVDGNLFSSTQPVGILANPVMGVDAVSSEPSYQELGVGTDGTPDQRLDMISDVKRFLGYPTIQVELDTAQLDFCVTNAIEQLRRRSSFGYKQGYFFLMTEAGKQNYLLTNKVNGNNKIVTIMSGHRTVSAFLSTAYGAGVYGQVVLQHLYNMGTFDLLSYFMVSQYVEQMEMLFASRLTFTWNEQTRVLQFHHTFAGTELVLLEVTVERTEQEILADRWVKNWVQAYALANARMILADIRGKFGSLPGAGGGVTLNAADLRTQAQADFDRLDKELDDMVAMDMESYGHGATFVIG